MVTAQHGFYGCSYIRISHILYINHKHWNMFQDNPISCPKLWCPNYHILNLRCPKIFLCQFEEMEMSPKYEQLLTVNRSEYNQLVSVLSLPLSLDFCKAVVRMEHTVRSVCLILLVFCLYICCCLLFVHLLLFIVCFVIYVHCMLLSFEKLVVLFPSVCYQLYQLFFKLTSIF